MPPSDSFLPATLVESSQSPALTQTQKLGCCQPIIDHYKSLLIIIDVLLDGGNLVMVEALQRLDERVGTSFIWRVSGREVRMELSCLVGGSRWRRKQELEE